MTLDITVTDMFCGAGGFTTGSVQAGATVKTAINHWKRAIETHNANYPDTTHVLTDLMHANPRRFPSTTILVASPECTSHSLSKGKKRVGQRQPALPGIEEDDEESVRAQEAEERSRASMWTPLDWAECHGYQAVLLENVVDAHLWRPFQAWLEAWRSLDYAFELVYFNSMHAHPTPQSRDRMYFVAWKRKNRRPDLSITPKAYCQRCEKNVLSVQCWKNPRRPYGKYRQQYVYRCRLCGTEVVPWYYAAANAIDWSIPTERIGDRKKPLREKTMQRIVYGLEKCSHLASSSSSRSIPPFILNLNHPNTRALDIERHPFPTQTAYDDTAFVTPFIAELHGTSTARSIMHPLATVCAGGLHHGLVTPPFILDHLGEYRPREITRPLSTICAAGNHQSLVTPPPAWLMSYYTHGSVRPVQEPVSTVTTLDRHALLTSDESVLPVRVEDCGFRMLVPEEIRAAMAFPADYILTGNRREKVKQLGNACTPPVIKLLMERVLASLA